MPRYPALEAALAGRDLDEFAAAAGVPVEIFAGFVPGGVACSFAYRDRIARALRLNPIELFSLDDELEPALGDVEAQGHPRYVTDGPTLRKIDRPK